VATELTSTTITNILEAVPGIKTVLRSPAADAMVRLTRAAASVGPFEIKDARELMRFAFRRGLINNEEHDKVLSDVEGAVQARTDRLAARQTARDDKHRGSPKPKSAAAKHPKPRVRPAPKKAAKPAPRKSKAAPKKAARPASKKSKVTPKKSKAAPKKAKSAAKAHAKKPAAKKPAAKKRH